MPVEAAARLARGLARRHGTDLEGAGLRLFEGRTLDTDVEFESVLASTPTVGGEVLGRFYERLIGAPTRRRTGLHVTPFDVARGVVEHLDPGWRSARAVVLDPAVGAAAFLLASADALVEAGVGVADAVAAQHGCDLDPDAVAIAEAALALWSIDHGLEPAPASGICVGDGLLDELPRADVVIGNPPFLNQLRAGSAAAPARRRALRERWGDLVGAYTDEAWLFLGAACRSVAAGGQVALLQPVSVLAARHGAAVRAEVAERMCLRGLWVADGPVFDAAVEVCAPFLRDRQDGGGPDMDAPTQRWRGPRFEVVPPAASEPGPGEWGRTAAVIGGTPAVGLRTAAGTLADLAHATAGFRDQFYGFAPHVSEAGDSEDSEAARLVTVGMIDPFRLRWGDTTFRFAGDHHRRPVVDLEALAAADARLADWARARQRAKVLVATQTRIVEAWVDEQGGVVPATPVISVEPHDAADLWPVAAMVMAPAIAADAAARSFGTALSVRAIKLAASDLLEMPLPIDAAAWRRGATLAERLQHEPAAARASLTARFVEAMAAGYGVAGESADRLASWWLERWPKRFP